MKKTEPNKVEKKDDKNSEKNKETKSLTLIEEDNQIKIKLTKKKTKNNSII